MEKKQVFFLLAFFWTVNIIGYILVLNIFPVIASISDSNAKQDREVSRTLDNIPVCPSADKQGVRNSKLIKNRTKTALDREHRDVLSVEMHNDSFMQASDDEPEKSYFKTFISNRFHRENDNINNSSMKSSLEKLDTLYYEHFANIAVDETATCKGRRFMIFKCDHRKCGGWGDRQKAIINTFLLALLTKRIFVLDIQKPCDVSKHLEPNVYNWSHCKEYIETLPYEFKKCYSKGCGFRSTINELYEDWQETAVFMEARLFGTYPRLINRIRHSVFIEKQLNWVEHHTDEEVMGIVLRSLFKPKPRLGDHITNFLKHSVKGRQLVCGHVRMFRNPSLPFDVIKTQGNFEQMNLLLKEFSDPKQFVVYLATDSDSVRDQAMETVRNYINVNRKIVHVDKLFGLTNEEACEGFYTALFEQYVLAKCDHLIIGFSEFAVMAAYMRGHSKGLYMYDLKTNYTAAQLTDIQRLYDIM